MIGGVAVLKRNDRFVYYLVTKEKYWNKPTLQALESSVKQMLKHMIDNKVIFCS